MSSIATINFLKLKPGVLSMDLTPGFYCFTHGINHLRRRKEVVKMKEYLRGRYAIKYGCSNNF
jgi:hypothetical protein